MAGQQNARTLKRNATVGKGMEAQVGGERNHCVLKKCNSPVGIQEESKKAGRSGKKRKKKEKGIVHIAPAISPTGNGSS